MITLALSFSLSALAAAQGKELERIKNAATVIDEILNIPDNVPQDLLDKAECIVVLPSVKKFAMDRGVGRPWQSWRAATSDSN